MKLYAIWARKPAARIKGLKSWKNELDQFKSPILFHVASLGEFEQVRPVIERIKQINPEKDLVLTFFSPSGYEIRQNYKYADHVMYLPLDTFKNMEYFLAKLRPSAIVFTKYDLWFNLIRIAQKNHIPCYLISSLFRPNQIYFKWYMRPLSHCLKSLRKIFTQDVQSFEILKEHGYSNAVSTGDTRVDRVLEIQKQSFEHSKIKQFTAGRKALIIGSSWPMDDDVTFASFNNLLNNGWCIIIAPHETHDARLNQLIDSLKYESIRYSEMSTLGKGEYDILIVDTIGDLSHLYQYANIAYIGGGFDQGIHNTLEPAAAGLPIIFGPNYLKFDEAKFMIDSKLAMSIQSKEEFSEALDFFMDLAIYDKTSKGLKEMIQDRAGATERIINTLTSDNIL